MFDMTKIMKLSREVVHFELLLNQRIEEVRRGVKNSQVEQVREQWLNKKNELETYLLSTSKRVLECSMIVP